LRCPRRTLGCESTRASPPHQRWARRSRRERHRGGHCAQHQKFRATLKRQRRAKHEARACAAHPPEAGVSSVSSSMLRAQGADGAAWLEAREACMQNGGATRRARQETRPIWNWLRAAAQRRRACRPPPPAQRVDGAHGSAVRRHSSGQRGRGRRYATGSPSEAFKKFISGDAGYRKLTKACQAGIVIATATLTAAASAAAAARRREAQRRRARRRLGSASLTQQRHHRGMRGFGTRAAAASVAGRTAASTSAS